MLMLDVCAGLGGASQAMRARGWDVVTLDNDPRFACDITADLTTWTWHGRRPDLLWASPPCQAFARKNMKCFYPNEPDPDMTLMDAARRVIDEIRPRYWVIENVRGAVPYLGAPAHRAGSFYLWGHFPALPANLPGCTKGWGHRSRGADRDPARRAMIPIALSTALALAIERQPMLLEVAA
jgi:hypothetical protein